MVRLNLPREKRSWINCRTWSSNASATFGPRIETSQNRWLTERISAVRRCPERSRSAEPKPVMLRIMRVLRGVGCGPAKVAARGERRQRGVGLRGAIGKGLREIRVRCTSREIGPHVVHAERYTFGISG